MVRSRIVPAGHGLEWFRKGLETFAAAPLAWIGITVLFLLVGVVLAVIPFAGMLWSVAIPIHTGGLMLGCEALRQGRPLEVRYLFNGFEQPRVQPLALVGALYLAGTLVFMIPAVLVMVGSTALSAVAVGASPTPGVAMASLVVVVAAVVAMMAGATALSMAIWFAPALVVFHDVPALEALKQSLRAAWQNVLAFVVFAAAMIGVGVIAVLPFLAAILLVAARGEHQSGAIAAVLIGGTGLFTFLCMLLFMPASWGAMHASYRDVFETDLPDS